MKDVLSLLSLVECLAPTLNWAEQCAAVHFLAYIEGDIRAGVTIVKRVARKTLLPAYNIIRPIEKFHHLVDLVDFLDTLTDNAPGRKFRSISCTVLYHLSETWSAFILLAWGPIFSALYYHTVYIQLPLSESGPEIVSGWWRHELDIPDGPDDLGTLGNEDTASLQQDVRSVWNWLSRYVPLDKAMRNPSISGLVYAMMCKAFLNMSWWMCRNACYLLDGIIGSDISVSGTPNGPLSWVVIGFNDFLWFPFFSDGTVFYAVLYPGQFLAAIPVILGYAAHCVPGVFHWTAPGTAVFQSHMTWFGWFYYLLTASRVLFCAALATGMHRAARDLREEAKSRLMVTRLDPHHDRDQLPHQIRDETWGYRAYYYWAAGLSWHAMELLRVMEHGPSLQSPCLAWFIQGFGISIRLMIILSHLSFGGWLE